MVFGFGHLNKDHQDNDEPRGRTGRTPVVGTGRGGVGNVRSVLPLISPCAFLRSCTC